MDTKKIESLIYQLLEALGEDPNRDGLLETPKRVAQMMEEVYEGIQYTNAEIAEMYGCLLYTSQAAMDQAYRFLAQRFLSSYELTQKMRRKQFEDLSLIHI